MKNLKKTLCTSCAVWFPRCRGRGTCLALLGSDTSPRCNANVFLSFSSTNLSPNSLSKSYCAKSYGSVFEKGEDIFVKKVIILVFRGWRDTQTSCRIKKTKQCMYSIDKKKGLQCYSIRVKWSNVTLSCSICS